MYTHVELHFLIDLYEESLVGSHYVTNHNTVWTSSHLHTHMLNTAMYLGSLKCLLSSRS